MTITQQLLTNLLTSVTVLLGVLGYLRVKGGDSRQSIEKAIILSTKIDMVLTTLVDINSKLDKHETNIEDVKLKMIRLEERLNNHINREM